ncbi:hypothetical protein SLU01_09600 [Sporosarcina luteola]|uniref:Uncharacterized protein n=1 Tax=Sporosarcina luteola TaxID=582850 RepID=A0A511Z5C0_9BACL|nr:DUF6501 family protein [Sporosarcina luteola]GEN82648.1 hypothetical protein SLU01_09600 [Sporosarcina luteola]
MSFMNWTTAPTLRKVVCTHANAEKYVVTDVLTPGKEYDVKNETDEFIFIVDNTGKVGGYYKTYFE